MSNLPTLHFFPLNPSPPGTYRQPFPLRLTNSETTMELGISNFGEIQPDGVAAGPSYIRNELKVILRLGP